MARESWSTMDEVLRDIEGEESQPMATAEKSRAWNVDPSTIPEVSDERSGSTGTEAEALAQLEGLLSIPGMLKIITSEVADESYPLTDHRHFVCHDVVRIGQDAKGRLQAWSAEGDWTVSLSGARGLLRRLLEVSLAS